jgi:hypothetical protein
MTNPTATIINNAISILSGGNSVVFNAHPGARRVSAENVRLLNRAILAAGGPADLVTAVPEPTIQTAQELMHHPRVRVLLVTGAHGPRGAQDRKPSLPARNHRRRCRPQTSSGGSHIARRQAVRNCEKDDDCGRGPSSTN